MNISDINNENPGSSIPSVTGKVTAVYKRRDVNTKRGPTTVQGIQLQDGNDSISVDLWGHDELLPFKGQEVKISAEKGLQLQEDQYWSEKKNKQVLKLSGGQNAIITSPGWGTPDPVEQQAASEESSRPNAPAFQPTTSEPRHAGPDERFVKERLNKFANLYLHCIKAAEYVDQTLPATMTPDHFQAAVSTLFIQATREGLQDRIAGGKFHQVEQAPPPPQRAPEPPRTPPPPPQRQAPNEPPYGQAFHPSDDEPSDLPF